MNSILFLRFGIILQFFAEELQKKYYLLEKIDFRSCLEAENWKATRPTAVCPSHAACARFAKSAIKKKTKSPLCLLFVVPLFTQFVLVPFFPNGMKKVNDLLLHNFYFCTHQFWNLESFSALHVRLFWDWICVASNFMFIPFFWPDSIHYSNFKRRVINYHCFNYVFNLVSSLENINTTF